MTNQQMAAGMRSYLAAEGYRITEGLLEHCWLSLQSRPFIMLMGRNDAPMALFARLFAQAMGANEENGRFACLQVKPDWMDFSDLFGYVRLSGVYEPGVMIDYVKKAQDDPEHPYFLCLDKVLLDRVEYYLNDILQPMESRGEPPRPLVTPAYFREDTAAAQKYGTLYLPENLYVICTLNLDETSLPLNQKFIDRIYTLELTAQDVCCTEKQGTAPAVQAANRCLQPAYFQIPQTEDPLIQRGFEAVAEMNRMLMKGSAYAGYRIGQDVVLYLLNNREAGLVSEAEALDQQILQKILPRVQGNMKTVSQVLEELAQFCADRYPRSARKIARMIQVGQQEEYTSCWV